MKIYSVQVEFTKGDTIQEIIDFFYDLKLKFPDLVVSYSNDIDFDLDAEKEDEEDR